MVVGLLICYLGLERSSEEVLWSSEHGHVGRVWSIVCLSYVFAGHGKYFLESCRRCTTRKVAGVQQHIGMMGVAGVHIVVDDTYCGRARKLVI